MPEELFERRVAKHRGLFGCYKEIANADVRVERQRMANQRVRMAFNRNDPEHSPLLSECSEGSYHESRRE